MQKASTRRRRAYSVTFRVILSYLRFYLTAKLRGKTYWDKHIKKVNQKNAIRIKDVMLELQGLFIKFGQLISILSNVLPPEFREPLEELQDNVPPHHFKELEAVIQQELGQSVSSIFTEIDPLPLAAASIGQVHRAKIGTEEVVIKIQHPQIDEIVHVDLDIIKNIVKLVARFMKIKGIEHLYQQIEQMIEEELNYLQEAQSMQIIKQNLSGETAFYVPKVYPEYSSRKVLVMEYCEGVKISNIQQIQDWNLDSEQLADSLIKGYCQMILEDGFYHADPHPGNVLVNQQGQIILLDFGAVAQLSKSMKDGIPKLISAMINQDAEEMVKVLRQLGFIAKGDDATKVAEKIIANVQDFIHNDLQLQNMNIQNISSEQFRKALGLVNIKEMTQIMQIPKDWVLLNRAVVLISGVSFVLAPDWNPMPTLQPYLQKKLIDQNGGLTQIIIDGIKKQLNAAINIPLELQKTLRKANKGKLQLEIKNLTPQLNAIRNVGQQLVWLLLFVASTYFYILLETNLKYSALANLFHTLTGLSFILFWWNVLKKNKK